jgi:hypothetical protein
VTAEIRNDVIVATERIKAPPEVVCPPRLPPTMLEIPRSTAGIRRWRSS